MKNVTIYSKGYCPFCKGAKKILNSKGILFTEIDVEFSETKRQEMVDRSGRLTVPQIFSDDTHIGGYDDLVSYYSAKKAA
jgi:glutaredoxin 3